MCCWFWSNVHSGGLDLWIASKKWGHLEWERFECVGASGVIECVNHRAQNCKLDRCLAVDM